MRIIDKEGRELLDGKPSGDPVGLMEPGYCVFTKDIDGPYLDTEFQITDIYPRAYIHVGFVETMGRAVGMVPKHEYDQVAEENEKLRLALDALKVAV